MTNNKGEGFWTDADQDQTWVEWQPEVRKIWYGC